MTGYLEDYVKTRDVVVRLARAVKEDFPEVVNYFREGKSYRVISEILPEDQERFARLEDSSPSVLQSAIRLALLELLSAEEFAACAQRNKEEGYAEGGRISFTEGLGYFSEEGKRNAAIARGTRRWETPDKEKALRLFQQGKSYEQIGERLDRTPNAIKCLLRKLL